MPAPQILPDITEKVSEVSLEDENTSSEAPSATKLMETRDSISSIDSDVSLSFDHRRRDSSPSQERTRSSRKDKQQLDDEDEGAHLADLSDSASDTGGKDSGCEVTPDVTEPIFTPPNDELADKIVQQVEFYFSDANITKDAFLLKHVKRNKEGFVSLKLISSFKRVKHITKDWRVVAHSLQRSTKLEINEAGTKLRRLNPLPQYDETTPSRTVVSVNMPIEKPTIENVAELFRGCGEIALIRILRPGNPVPVDVRQFINKNPSLSGAVCALIEFVRSASARNALQLQSQHPDLKVYELNCVPHPERKKKVGGNGNGGNYKQHAAANIRHHSIDSTTSDYTTGSEAEDRMLRNHHNHHQQQQCRRMVRRGSSPFEPAAWLQRRLSASSTEASFAMFAPRRLSYSSSSRESSESNLFVPRRVSTCSLLAASGGPGPTELCPQHYYIAMPMNHPMAAPYYQRRMSSSNGIMDYPTRSRSNSSATFQSSSENNIVRLPRGPDGSRGFQRTQQVI